MTSRATLCKNCEVDCCQHPILSTDEYMRLLLAVGTGAPLAMREGNGWQFKEPCPAKSDKGCIISYDDRPIVCKLYPFMPVPTRTKGTMLLLDLECPYWMVFGKDIEKAKEELKKYGS
jgi:Fe-S-cluster containining protein